MKRQISNINYSLLTENRVSKNINLARKYLKNNNYNDEHAQNILDDIRTDIFNVRKAQCKFLLGVTRLYLDGELNDATKIRELNNILLLICSDAHVNKYDYNLNNLSLDELLNRFSLLKDEYVEQEKNKRKGNTYSKNNDYTIVKIPNFKAASKYSNYTEWCITYDSNMYNNYTNDGLGLFYFCLKKGFENVEEVEGKNAPLDEYGLSMIAVSVTEDGMPNTITSRWNHNMGGNDGVMSVEELEELLGVNFYDVFLPYSEEEIEQKRKIVLDPFMGAKIRLENGEDPNDIFDEINEQYNGCIIVKLKNKMSLINRYGELIGNGNLWFNFIDDFDDDFAKVERDDYKWSFIDENGNLIGNGNLWFDYIEYFYNDFAIVQRDDNKYSYLDKNGKLIANGNLWLDEIDTFRNGFAIIQGNDNKYTFIDKNGKPIGDGNQWFIDVGYFTNGFACVQRDDKKWSYIDTNGRLIGDGNLWFKDNDDFENGFARVQRDDDKWSLINTNGELIGNGNAWFDYVGNFYNNFAKVEYNDEWYYIDINVNFYDVQTKEKIQKSVKENKNKIKNKNMKRQVIRLTENDLHNLVIKSVKRYLNEISTKTVHAARNKAINMSKNDKLSNIDKTLKNRQAHKFDDELKKRMAQEHDWDDSKSLSQQYQNMSFSPNDYSNKQLRGAKYYKDMEDGVFDYKDGSWKRKIKESLYKTINNFIKEDIDNSKHDNMIEYAKEWKNNGGSFKEWADNILQDNKNYTIDDLQDFWYAS